MNLTNSRGKYTPDAVLSASTFSSFFYIKLHLSCDCYGGTKICSNGPGHMTKMAAVAIYGKNLKKIFFSGTKRPMTLNLGMHHRVLEYYKICSIDDPGLTLTYFLARSNLVPYAFEWEKDKTVDFSETFVVYVIWNWQQMTEVTRSFCWHQNFVPWGLYAPAPGLYTCIKSWKKKCIKSRFLWNLQQMGKVIRPFCWHQNFVPWGLSVPALGLYICIE